MLAVFLFEVVALIHAAGSGDDGASTWSILLLIFAPLAVVGIIGGGLLRAVRDRETEEGEGTTSSNEEER